MWLNWRTGEVGNIDDLIILDIPPDAIDDLTDYMENLSVKDRYLVGFLFGKGIDAN